MTGTEFADTVRDETATALHRLGSDKYLVAATEADLSPAAVWRTVATSAASGRDTFAAWAEGAGDAAETFAAAAETEADHYERVAGALDALDAPAPETGSNDPLDRALQSADDAVERAGALVGRGLVADRTRLQVVNFFVNEGDTGGADLARELRADADDQVDAGVALLAATCENEADRDRARGAATAVVEAAYDDYVQRLEAMGVDPKPVC